MKNPFENLSDPSSFGLSDSTVHFYISGPAGKLGAWSVFLFLSLFCILFYLLMFYSVASVSYAVNRYL